ncbi:YbaB/EbfC family nucleoid-associated protein [Couchioplanes caeruleus]|uniref:YbaB/EbfC family nucleoid-associated protein n=1 Tax=Couchioplanes caeruleus TaxID=56438 RepID=UPI001B804FAB|nr:YbaB/EbfC family nucleoid-associated protein [Couchioplanes caeruleus]
MAAAEQAERARSLSHRIEQASMTVESAGGEVRVTVDSTGGLAGLRFHASARNLPQDRLAELVLSTSRRAQAELAKSMDKVVAELYGAGSDTARFVTSAYADRFPSEPDEDGDRS